MSFLASALLVFAQGAVAFLSPCVLPVIPLYLGYLAGDMGGEADVEGEGGSPRRTMLTNALCFSLGVSAAFFVLGLAASAVGGLLTDNREVISAVGGVVVIVLGLYQLGVLRRPDVLERERRLPLSLDRLAMSPWVALLMGFAFSFAWTPCVGPTLASVLLMAATESTQALGFLLIAVYSLGFCIPFLLVALMADRALGLLKAHPSVMRRAVQVGGALLVVMGALMVTGGMSSLSSIAASLGGATNQGEVTSVQDVSSPDAASQPTTTTGKDFTLSDQNGTTHALSDYRGRVVVLNFWATWCTYCKQEMPDIQALYDERGANAGDVVVLGVANPKDDSHPRNGDVSADEVGAFLSANGYTYPVGSVLKVGVSGAFAREPACY